MIRPGEGPQGRHARTGQLLEEPTALGAHAADYDSVRVELVCARAAQHQPDQQDVGEIRDENGVRH